MKNILFIHQSSELYGSDKTLLLLLTHLDRLLFNPIVVLPNEGPLKSELEKINIKVVIAPVLKLYRNMFSFKNMIQFYKDYKKAINILDTINKEYTIDVVYSNTLAVLLGMIYSRKRQIKHIWHVHEIIVHPKSIANIFPKLLLRYADLVICNSYATQNNLTQRAPNLVNKSIVIHNGIETNETSISYKNKEDFGFSSSDIVITLVGRISRLKGHKWFLNTFIDYLDKLEDINVLFVGSPVVGQEFYLKEVEEIIISNKLEKRIKIIPFTSDLNAIWKNTDIAIMPSTEAESFGLVAAEAMLAQKPVIASNHGGLTEIIVHNKSGILVEPNNKAELYEAILKLKSNPDLRVKLGDNGRKRILAEFSLEKYIQNITDSIKHI
jgi:glycosyltransferase involved in cell wall biosynthesis